MKTLTMRNKILATVASIILLGAFFYVVLSPISAEAASCSLSAGQGDVLVKFPNVTLCGSGCDGGYVSTNTNIPAGKYKVTVHTFDEHSEHGGQGQQDETVFLRLISQSGATIATTGKTNDIPENRDHMVTVVENNLSISDTAKVAFAVHSRYPANTRNSVTPVCALFDKIVEPVVVSVSCDVSDTSVNVGENVKFSASGSGGVGGYTYSWSNDVSGSGETITRSFNNPGSYAAKVTATDSNGNKASKSCPVVVVKEVDQDLNLTCTVSDTSIKVGNSVTYTANATGGSGNYSYSWNGAVDGTGSQKVRTFNSVGSFNASVVVTDGNNNTKSANCPTVVVSNDDDPEDFNITCEVDDTSVEIDDRVRFSVDINGGNSPFRYNWDGDIEGEDDDNSTLTVKYDDDGSKHVRVTVTDDDGKSDSDDCPTVRVDEEDDDLDVTCRVSDTSVDVGDSVRFTVDVDGGNSPFEYQWDGDIEGEDDDERSIRVEYDDEGRYDVEITVEDDDGNEDSDDCPTVRVGDDRDVVTRSTPSGTPAGLESVFLNQIPYTGLKEDMGKILGYVSLLILWSIVIGLVLYRRYQRGLRSAEIAEFKNQNRLGR